MNHFLKNISPSLKLEATVQIFESTFTENIIISSILTDNNESTMRFIVRRMDVTLTTPEQSLFVMDSEPDQADDYQYCMYFV